MEEDRLVVACGWGRVKGWKGEGIGSWEVFLEIDRDYCPELYIWRGENVQCVVVLFAISLTSIRDCSFLMFRCLAVVPMYHIW